MTNFRTKAGLIIFTVLVFTLFSFQFVFADPKTVEEKMAFVDGNYSSKVKIARYHYLLTTLEKKTGDSIARIGDMTVKAQEILREKHGKEMTLLDLLEGVNKSISSGSKTPFANAIGVYIFLVGQ